MSGSGPTKWRGFLPFFIIGFLANIVFYTAWLVWAVIASDFLKHNPAHSTAASWSEIATSPLLAISLTIFGSLLAIVVAALAAKYLCETKGQFPLSLTPPLLLVCVVASFVQMSLLGINHWQGNPHRGEELLRLAMAQVPMLFAFWVWGREPVARPRVLRGTWS